MKSTQFDASLEWYFAPVGSLTMSVFYKDLKNFFIPGAFPRNYLNPSTGVTQNVEYTTTRSGGDRKSTRLNSSHVAISYAVFCLKKKNTGKTAIECIKTSNKR